MLDVNNIKYIKKLGAGMFGTTYLVEIDHKKYALKIQHILPEHRKKTFKHELWRELDLYEYINTLKPNELKFFTRLHDYKIYDNCKHVQKRPFEFIQDDDFAKKINKLDQSDWCVEYLLDYKGKQTFGNFISTNKITPHKCRSFLLQIINMNLILAEKGYSHNDLHNDNIMIQPTSEKHFLFQGHKIPYYGYQLSAIDYGEVLHKKFSMKKDYFYNLFIKDFDQYIFHQCMFGVINTSTNFDKYMFTCRKKSRKMPWERNKNSHDVFLRKIITLHPKFWNNARDLYIKLYPKTAPLFPIIENTKEIQKNIESKENKKIFTGDIWLVLFRISTMFQILHPKLHSKYNDWCSYHQPNLPKKHILELLKITNTKDLITYIINIPFV